MYTIPYVGKPYVVTDTHISNTDELLRRIIEGYERFGHKLRGTNISVDRYYTSIPIAEWLLQKKVTMIGTMKSIRKGIPTELKKIDTQDPNTWIACQHSNGPVALNSWVVNTKSGKRNVLLLHTMNAVHYVTDDSKKKPRMYKVYDYTKLKV